jgi:hypothetical protein
MPNITPVDMPQRVPQVAHEAQVAVVALGHCAACVALQRAYQVFKLVL